MWGICYKIEKGEISQRVAAQNLIDNDSHHP
jgi:hypothetical protein